MPEIISQNTKTDNLNSTFTPQNNNSEAIQEIPTNIPTYEPTDEEKESASKKTGLVALGTIAIVGTGLGIYGLRKASKLSSAKDILEKANKEFETKVENLEKDKNELQDTVNKLCSDNDSLKQQIQDLQNQPKSKSICEKISDFFKNLFRTKNA